MNKIPKNWIELPLSELAFFQNGHAFYKDGYSDKGLIAFDLMNVNEEGKLRFSERDKFVSPELCKRYSRFILNRGDIVIVMTDMTQRLGILGKCVIIDKDNSYILNQRMGRIIPNNSKILTRYLYYFINSPLFLKPLHSLSKGAVQKYVNTGDIKENKVLVPPIQTQKRIAVILSAYDDLIENNTRRVKILEEMARRIYEEWFVEFRFPGHENIRIVEDEFGLIPEGLNVKKIDKVAKINAQSVKRGREPEEILYVDIASVSTGKIDNVQAMPFDEAPGRARRIVKHGDIIWSNVRPNRKSYALVTNPPQNMIVSTGFTVVSASSIPYSFLYLAITTEDFASYLTNRAKGAAYPAVGSEDFAYAKILIPNARLLSSFDELAEPMQIEKDLLLRKNDILRRTRDLLLPKLISGEIDVSDFTNL